MRYHVRVQVQSLLEEAEFHPVVVDTFGTLEVGHGFSLLEFTQFEEEDPTPVLTSIELRRDTVAMQRSDHTTMIFDRRLPSYHPFLTQSGRLVSMTVVPHQVDWSQRKGQGSLRLAYDLIYDGHIRSRHDIVFDFCPTYGDD